MRDSQLLPPRLEQLAPVRCGWLPLPPEAKLSVSGFALASAISSLTDLTGNATGITSMLGCDTSNDMAAKSLSESYGSFGNQAGIDRMGVVMNKSV